MLTFQVNANNKCPHAKHLKIHLKDHQSSLLDSIRFVRYNYVDTLDAFHDDYTARADDPPFNFLFRLKPTTTTNIKKHFDMTDLSLEVTLKKPNKIPIGPWFCSCEQYREIKYIEYSFSVFDVFDYSIELIGSGEEQQFNVFDDQVTIVYGDAIKKKMAATRTTECQMDERSILNPGAKMKALKYVDSKGKIAIPWQFILNSNKYRYTIEVAVNELKLNQAFVITLRKLLEEQDFSFDSALSGNAAHSYLSNSLRDHRLKKEQDNMAMKVTLKEAK
ncbi:MAG: hypothetical protein HRT35_11975 [Algicola sp.]|nr:hypothetical protein [Algicola sp.]